MQTVEHGERLESLSEEIAPRDVVKGLVIALISMILAFILYKILPYDEYANRGLALLFFIGSLWLTEAVHITITALSVPVLAVLLGMPGKPVRDKATNMLLENAADIPPLGIKAALANFASPTIFLFFGGFALAMALHAQQLDRKIVYAIIRLSKEKMFYAVFGLFIATALLSMWISNTATAAMMLPLALGLISNIPADEKFRSTRTFILLGVAYSASIGGIGAIVGSPPNGIAAAELNMDFAAWMKIGLPVMLLLLPTLLACMYLVLRPQLNYQAKIQIEEIPWTWRRIITLLVFATIALLWIFGKFIKTHTGLPISDGLVAVLAAVLVVALGLCTWRQVSDNTDWGVLLLFGGGLTLSAVLQNSGASYVLGNQVAVTFGSASSIVLILAVTTLIIFLTEFSSNTASAALLVPVFAGVAAQVGMPKEVLVLIIAIGASCAFMLPVATPPNAIVFGTGYIRQIDMIKVGLILNFVSIAFLSIVGILML